MPGSGDSLDIDAKKGSVGFGNILTSDRDDPSGGDSLKKEIGQDEFLAPPGVKAGWIYRLKKSDLIEIDFDAESCRRPFELREMKTQTDKPATIEEENTNKRPERRYRHGGQLPGHENNSEKKLSRRGI
ncbi:hypothetical protein JTB14_020271 [Gonioctena quinquepunctata]|nr:hypothetical protein JTB14_020271 [Gonioctena quinquepunctata]